MRIARWLLGGGPEHVGLVLGNDASGKTTLLYRLKLGLWVTTIPTIGFNIETLEYPDGGRVTLWDIGGCDKMRSLTGLYMIKERFIVFVQSVQDLDPDRVEFSLEYLRMCMETMMEHGATNMFILFNKQDLLAPDEREAVIKDLKGKIESEIAPYASTLDVKIMDYPGLSAATGEQLHRVMDEIRQTLGQTEKPATDTKKVMERIEKGPSEEELIERINKAKAESADAHSFWGAFMDGSLLAWDHYTHLRAGFFVMHDCLARGLGLLECADEFMAHLNRLREGNPERFRNTAHKTMTIFWLHQIQVACIDHQTSKQLDKFPAQSEYADIVLSAPRLMNSGLWRFYYSKDLLFTPEAREDWHLPDLQPLPTISRADLSDRRLPQQSGVSRHDRLPRFAFSVVQKTLSSKLRRGGVVKQALDALQSSTMRLRASDPSMPPYSETQAYFWIQIVHAYLKSLEAESSQGVGLGGSVSALTFEAFKSLFDINGDEWRKYYSKSTWEGVAARMGFVNPDKKALPNVFGMPSQARIDLARSQMVNAISHRSIRFPDLPPREDLDLFAAVLMDEAKLVPGDEVNVESHASLLCFLYRRLSGQSKSSATSTKRGDASLASSTALEICRRLGMTQGVFWVQQVQIALAGVSAVSFEEFVRGSSYLAYEDLPLVYYSPQLWQSVEAEEVFMSPDRRSLRSVVL
ncbi:hypothetical protein F66182_8605 [Fusarium sp. NRRL 66182]|nr:hypothetical protein F66182_8605 [Fusarium sp. NRRL 66182]